MKTVASPDDEESDKHRLNRFNVLYCDCLYHEQLRADDEDDRREQAEMEER